MNNTWQWEEVYWAAKWPNLDSSDQVAEGRKSDTNL